MLNLCSIENNAIKGAPGPARHRRYWTMLLFLFSLLICSPSLAERGAMEIGLSSHYSWPQMDVDEFDPALDYGFIFHYWLNDTTSFQAGFEQLAFEGPLKVDGKDKGMVFDVGVIELGIRYRPEVDFLFKPYLEGGFGYQFWSTKPGASIIESRNGGTIAYFAGTGLEYEFYHTVTAGLNLRYRYMPMNEKLEEEAITIGPNLYDVKDTKLEMAGYPSAGFELVWRFK